MGLIIIEGAQQWEEGQGHGWEGYSREKKTPSVQIAWHNWFTELAQTLRVILEKHDDVIAMYCKHVFLE